jgi:hypothetical protein
MAAMATGQQWVAELNAAVGALNTAADRLQPHLGDSGVCLYCDAYITQGVAVAGAYCGHQGLTNKSLCRCHYSRRAVCFFCWNCTVSGKTGRFNSAFTVLRKLADTMVKQADKLEALLPPLPASVPVASAVRPNVCLMCNNPYGKIGACGSPGALRASCGCTGYGWACASPKGYSADVIAEHVHNNQPCSLSVYDDCYRCRQKKLAAAAALAKLEPKTKLMRPTVCLMCNNPYGKVDDDVPGVMRAGCGCVGYGLACVFPEQYTVDTITTHVHQSQPCGLSLKENDCYRCRQKNKK